MSLLNKTKQENSKLKEEINDLRKNFDYIDKSFNLKNLINKATGQKLAAMDFASIMANRENELNECRRILHNSVLRFKNIFENNHDEFSQTLTDSMRNFMEGKSLEDKYLYYLEKLLKYQEYKDKKEINLKNELEAKESKILSLNRELFLRNSMFDEEKENNADGAKTKSKKRHSYNSSVINSVLNSEISKSIFKTTNKRKFADINNNTNLNINNNNNNYINQDKMILDKVPKQDNNNYFITKTDNGAQENFNNFNIY